MTSKTRLPAKSAEEKALALRWQPGFGVREPKVALVTGSFGARVPFLLAVALVAAGLSDPLVESLSNSGIFGGHYADNNHLGVVPTLFAGSFVALEMLAPRFREILRRSASDSRRSLVDVGSGLATRSFTRDLPLIFELQLFSLLALESTEQLIAGGRLLGGTAWLGGPVFCALALGGCMRAIVRTFATIVRTVARSIWLAIGSAAGG